MSQIRATFSGGVVAVPELKSFDSGSKVLEFPVYVNHQRKNKDTDKYEDTGDVSKIRVQLWGDRATEDIRKGDIVEVIGSLVEKEFDRKDNTKGRQLQTDYVESVSVKYRKDEGAPAGDGFTPSATGGGF